MPMLIERHVDVDSKTQAKLVASKARAQCHQVRSVRCPCCGFHLLDVYGHDHYYIRVKCRKCKFEETIDTALFRTIARSKQKRLKAYCDDIGNMLQQK